MTEIITCRLVSTGAWGYAFYDGGGERIGSVDAASAPSAPVRIEGPGISWYSRFSIDTMIVPGTSRRVMDDRTGGEVYRLIYWRPGLYEVRTPETSVQAEIREGTYLFGKPFMPVTAMTERTAGTERVPERRGTEILPAFRTKVFDRISDSYLMMVLSFPALRFY